MMRRTSYTITRYVGGHIVDVETRVQLPAARHAYALAAYDMLRANALLDRAIATRTMREVIKHNRTDNPRAHVQCVHDRVEFVRNVCEA